MGIGNIGSFLGNLFGTNPPAATPPTRRSDPNPLPNIDVSLARFKPMSEGEALKALVHRPSPNIAVDVHLQDGTTVAGRAVARGDYSPVRGGNFPLTTIPDPNGSDRELSVWISSNEAHALRAQGHDVTRVREVAVHQS